MLHSYAFSIICLNIDTLSVVPLPVDKCMYFEN
jgi:hypothetical protein